MECQVYKKELHYAFYRTHIVPVHFECSEWRSILISGNLRGIEKVVESCAVVY